MNIALIGYGKMGKTVEEIAVKKGHTISLRINSSNINDLNRENLKNTDVAIEFTNPENAVKNILLCIESGVPVVCGTTGWLNRYDEIKNAVTQNNAGFLYASNFSVGVNIFFELNKKLAALMAHQSYEPCIEEIHHTQKKDAPSGTAITLAEQILEAFPNKKRWINSAADHSEDLAVISKRIDPAPGTHHVKYTSEIDDIEIIHTAHNRKGFASGAVLAAEFIKDKKGVFSMKDVLLL